MCTPAPQKLWNRDGKLPWSYVKHIQLGRKFYKILTSLCLFPQGKTEVQTRVQQGCIRAWECVYVCVCVYLSLGNCNSHLHFGLKGTRVMKWDYWMGSSRSPEAAVHTQLSLMNSFMFIIELSWSSLAPGGRLERLHKLHITEHTSSFIRWCSHLSSRAESLIQNKKQNKQKHSGKKKKKNSTNETQEKCFFRLQRDWTMWTQK